jgi:hypothetical protein
MCSYFFLFYTWTFMCPYFLFNKDASGMDIWTELNMLWIYIRKFNLNRMNTWIIQSKHVMGCKNLKDNYSSSLKSMSKTISPFLIILTMTMTHMMAFVSSIYIRHLRCDLNSCDDDLFFNLHMVRKIYIYNTCGMAGFQCWWIMNVQAPWVLQCFFFSCGNSSKGHNGVCCPVFSTI